MTPVRLMVGGLLMAAAGFGLLALVDRPDPLPILVAGSIIYSLGLSPVVILATDLVVGSAPVERAGAAGAISETSSELGGALGIAILGSAGVALYRSIMNAAAPGGIPPEAMEVARGTLGGALAVAGRLPEPVGAALLATARQAFTQSVELMAVICTILSLAAALGTAVVLRRPQPQADPHAV
jgi:DHA2 family multidrug resistance protein-like MFS transporter